MKRIAKRYAAARPKIIGIILPVLLFPALGANFAYAAGALEIENEESPISLRAEIRAVFETNQELTVEAAAELSGSGLPHPSSPPNFGRYGKPVWGFATIVNRTQTREWTLVYSLPTVEDVRVYMRVQGEQNFKQLSELGHGVVLPFSGYRSPTFSLVLPSNTPIEIATRLATRAPIGFHLELWSGSTYFEAERRHLGFAGLASAVPLVVVTYGLILATVLRRHGVLSLMIVLAFKLIIDAWLSGLGAVVMPFVPRHSWPTLGFIAVGVFVVACVFHLRRFFELPSTAPRLDRAFLTIATSSVCLTAIELTGTMNVRFLIQLLAPLVFASFTALSAYQAWRKRDVGSVAYCLAWSLFLSEAVTQFVKLIALASFSEPSLIFSQSAIASLLFGIAIFARLRDQDRSLTRSLLESNERFRLAIEGSAAAIYEYSYQDRRFVAAPRLSEMLGVAAGLSPRPVLRSLSSDARKNLFGGLRTALLHASPGFRVELSIRSQNGERRIFAVTGAIQYNQNGNARRVCGSIIDVTSDAALEMEQALRALVSSDRDRIERSLQARTNFYAAANHDLRHPLLSLGLYLEMLSKDASSARLTSFLPQILDAHRSALSYLDRIVSLARSDVADAPAPKLEALNPILNVLAERHRFDAVRKGLQLRYVPTTLKIDTDALLLERLIGNLLSNAIQNTSRGRILIGCRRRTNGLRIDIIDTGPGLPSDVFEQIKSERLIRRPRLTEGLRLGLAIAQRMAAELGGTLDAETWLGKGSRLSVIFGNLDPQRRASSPQRDDRVGAE